MPSEIYNPFGIAQLGNIRKHAGSLRTFAWGFLFAEDGFQAISQRVMMGLIRGKDAMPQYAGTKQRVADVILENDGKKPVRIERVQGSYLTFDEKGQVHKDLVASLFAALETGMALEEALRKPQTKIIDLTPKLNREKWERENRWTLSKDDLDVFRLRISPPFGFQH